MQERTDTSASISGVSSAAGSVQPISGDGTAWRCTICGRKSPELNFESATCEQRLATTDVRTCAALPARQEGCSRRLGSKQLACLRDEGQCTMSTSSEDICVECLLQTSSSEVGGLRREHSSSGEDGRSRKNCDASLQRRQARLARQQRHAVERQQQQQCAHEAVGEVDPGSGSSSAASGRVRTTDDDSLAANEETTLDAGAALADLPPLWQNIGLLASAGRRTASHLGVAAETLAVTNARLGPAASGGNIVSPTCTSLGEEEVPVQNSGANCRHEPLQPSSAGLGANTDAGRAVDREVVGCSRGKSRVSCSCGDNGGTSCGSGCTNRNGDGSECGSNSNMSSCGTCGTAPISNRDTTHSENEVGHHPGIFAAVRLRASVPNTEAASLSVLALDLSRFDVSVASHGAANSASSRSLSRPRLSETDEAVMAALQQAYCTTIDAAAYAGIVAIADVIDMSAIANCIALFMRRLVGFARRIGEFATLPPEVQLAALRQAALPCVALCSAQAYNPAGDCWDCGSGCGGRSHLPLASLGSALPPAVVDEHRTLASAIRRLLPRDAAAGRCEDVFVFALLHVIVLLSPECTTAETAAEADGETVAARLADAQHRYIMLLGRLLQTRLSFARAAALLPMLLRCVDACKQATANVAAALGTCDRLHVDLLLLEVLSPTLAEPQAADVQ